MPWRQLLENANKAVVVPWVGMNTVTDGTRYWTVRNRPPQHGWYTFNDTGNRRIDLTVEVEAPINFPEGIAVYSGYLVGNRLIPSDLRGVPHGAALAENTAPVFIIPEGLERIAKVKVGKFFTANVFLESTFSEMCGQVIQCYEDRTTIDGLRGVDPALELAFRWITRQRELREEEDFRREAARREEERRQKFKETFGTAEGRRELIDSDIREALKATLQLTGSEFLDFRNGPGRDELIVKYRVGGYRLECVVNKYTLNVLDSGICLTDHGTGEKGDRYFTLESLPSVVREAIDEDKLVIYRRG